jgi:FkbM family methyltransferase
MRSLDFYWEKIEREGLSTILRRRAYWYRLRAIDRYRRSAGWLVERLGDRVRIDGLIFSTASPVIARVKKGELLLDRHEPEERRLLERWLRTDLPVVELGGAMGVISCLTNRRLARPQDHVVVEANPGIIPLLERNRDLNRCGFRVINKALAYDADTVAFNVHSSFTESRIGDDSGMAVLAPTTSLGAILAEAGFDQISLICDIEGAEAALVERELDTLQRHVRTLLVEIHPYLIGQETAAWINRALEGAGFALRDQAGNNWVFTRD